jgi:hypothetical protein
MGAERMKMQIKVKIVFIVVSPFVQIAKPIR